MSTLSGGTPAHARAAEPSAEVRIARLEARVSTLQQEVTDIATNQLTDEASLRSQPLFGPYPFPASKAPIWFAAMDDDQRTPAGAVTGITSQSQAITIPSAP